MNKRAHIFIHGDVIGVGFRSWTVQQAQDKQLNGFVRNHDHNTVEAVFEGPEDRVKQVIDLCHKGPEVAWVEKVDVRWEEAKNEFEGFEVKY